MAPEPKALAWPLSQVDRPGAKKSEVRDAEEGSDLASRGAGAP